MKIRFKTETVKSWAILLLMLISVSVANAQDKVSGVVKDDTGETMPGVSVTVKGSKSVGAVTDIDGNFTINEAAVLCLLSLSLAITHKRLRLLQESR